MICSFSKDFSQSAFTDVENLFITEYMPIAEGDAVKVYLYGLYLCQYPDLDKNEEQIAQILKMDIDKICDCFLFWEEFGLLSVLSRSPLNVKYLPVRSFSSGKPRKFKAEKYTEFTKSLQALIPNRMISMSEYTEYFNVMETYSIKPDAMLMIVKYCTDKKGNDISYRYVSKVAKDFANRDITTTDKVEKELASYVAKSAVIEKILKALSLRRQPDFEDSNLLKKWTQELNFEVDSIIFAASQIKKGNLAKLDEFIMELYASKSFSKEEISSYVKGKQDVYDLAVKINKALSIYVDVIDTVVNTYTKKWLSFGFDSQTLLYVASVCFKSGKNTLQDMDELIETLRQRGFITLSSVGDYFDNIKKDDLFISKLLSVAGINRRPTPWDRDNLNMWKSWNFSEEMILEAGKIAVGKSSPIAYINGILSNWKNNSVFSTDQIDKPSSSDDSQEEYNNIYRERRQKALSIAQKNNEIAMSIDGFSEILSRLNSIEKDLAFAEISGDESSLSKLEREKKELNENAEKLLSTNGLSLIDLSPRYTCEKCFDTGYVGTHKCDCLNK